MCLQVCDEFPDVAQNSVLELDAVQVDHAEIILVMDVLEYLPDKVPQGEELGFHEAVVDFHGLVSPVVACIALLTFAVLILLVAIGFVVVFVAVIFSALFTCCLSCFLLPGLSLLASSITITEVLLQVEASLLQIEDDVVETFLEDGHVGADSLQFFLRGFQALLDQFADDPDIMRQLFVALDVWHQQVRVFELEQREHNGVNPVDLLQRYVHVVQNVVE